MPLVCKVKHCSPDLVLFIRGHGQINVEDVNKFGQFFNNHLGGSTKFRVLYDLREVENASMSVVTALAQYIVKFEQKSKEKVLGSSILVYGAVVENLLRLVFSFKEPTTPYIVTADLQKACEFLDTL